MSNPNPVDRRALLFDIALQPAVAHLRSPGFHERRNLATREALMRRIRAEFTEVPGLSLTVPQGMKLFDLSESVTLRIFSALVREEVLWLTTDGRFAANGDALSVTWLTMLRSVCRAGIDESRNIVLAPFVPLPWHK